MLLRLDRITDEQRLQVVLLVDQMVYTTDTKKLFIGDGNTPGGVDLFDTIIDSKIPKNTLTLQFLSDDERLSQVIDSNKVIYTFDKGELFVGDGKIVGGLIVVPSHITNIEEDKLPRLGGSLDINKQDIFGEGSIFISGFINADYIKANSSISADVIDTDKISNGTVGLIIEPGSRGLTISGIQQSGKAMGAVITTKQARGSLDAPEVTQKGDLLSGIHATVFNGQSYKMVGGLGFEQFDDVTPEGFIPTHFRVLLTRETTDPVILEFDNTGLLTSPAIKVGSYTTESLPQATEGTIVFDSITKQFKGYNGSNWVVLG